MWNFFLLNWSFSPAIVVNPFSTNYPFLYALKTSENLRFYDVCWGYKSGTLVENGLSISVMRRADCTIFYIALPCLKKIFWRPLLKKNQEVCSVNFTFFKRSNFITQADVEQKLRRGVFLSSPVSALQNLEYGRTKQR